MTIGEFIEATNRLENYYGKEYTKEQLKIMHEELQDLSIDRYKQLISAIMKKSKFLPKIADFLEVDNEIPYSRKEDQKIVECNICNGTGYIFYKKTIADENMTYNFACRCECENGRNKNKQIPTYQELGIMV